MPNRHFLVKFWKWQKKTVSILPHEAKALFCLPYLVQGKIAPVVILPHEAKYLISYIGGSGLDRIQFYRVVIGLRLRNLSVRSSLVGWRFGLGCCLYKSVIRDLCSKQISKNRQIKWFEINAMHFPLSSEISDLPNFWLQAICACAERFSRSEILHAFPVCGWARFQIIYFASALLVLL